MAGDRVRSGSARPRRWNARVVGWRDTHPWRWAAVIAAAVAVLGSPREVALPWAPRGGALRYAAGLFLIWGLLGSLRAWWLGRAHPRDRPPRRPE